MAARTGGRSDTRLIVTMIVSTVVLLAVIVGGTLILQAARSAPIDTRDLGPRVENTIVHTAEDGAATTYRIQGEWSAWQAALDADAVEGWTGTYEGEGESVVYHVSRFGSHADVAAFTRAQVDAVTAAGGTVREERDTNTDGTGRMWILDTADEDAPVTYVWDNGRGLALRLDGTDWPVYHVYVGNTL